METKKQIRERLVRDTAKYLEDNGIIKRPKPPIKKKRKAKGKSKVTKELWRNPPLKSKTEFDHTATDTHVEQLSCSRIQCASPGLARQMASKIIANGGKATVKGNIVLAKSKKAAHVAQKTLELQQLLKGE